MKAFPWAWSRKHKHKLINMLFEMTSKIVNKSENVQRKFSFGNIPTCPPHPPTCPLYVTQWLYHIVNYALLGAHLRLFSQQRSYCFFCFFLSFSLSFFFGKQKCVCGVGGGGYFTTIAPCFQHEWGHVCGSGQWGSVALVKYTLPLHKSQQLWSLPKIMPRRLFWKKFSTLDVSCSSPLCSIGSYFGEAWVLLSNLLSCLQMKVSGGAAHKKLFLPFLERPDFSKLHFIFYFVKIKKTAFCPSVHYVC